MIIFKFYSILFLQYCSDYTVSDKEKYPTFIRTKPTESQISRSVASLLMTYNWTKVTFVYSNENEFQHTAKTIIDVSFRFCFSETSESQDITRGGGARGVMVKAMDCRIVVSEFELQSRWLRSLSDKYPRERYEPSYSPSYGLNSITTVLGEWLWH